MTFLSVGGVENGTDTAADARENVEFGNALLDTTIFLLDTDTPPTVVSTSYGDNEENIDPEIAQ